MDNHRQVYREEAYELLTELETGLLELEKNPHNLEIIGQVFRALHTIKGSGAMFGFDEIASFTHEVETVFDLVRDGKIEVSKDLINLSLRAKDQIKHMLDIADTEEPIDQETLNDIISSYRSYISDTPQKEAPRDLTDHVVASNQIEVTYRIRFRPKPYIFQNGTNPILLLDQLRELGECKIIAQPDAIPLIHAINPESCYVYWDIILTTKKTLDDIKDIFIFVEDCADIKIDMIDLENDLDEDESGYRLGEILVQRGDLTPSDVQHALNSQKRIGEILVEADLVNPAAVESALAEQEFIKTSRKKRRDGVVQSFVRVPSDRLDTLVNLVGELVSVQARLSRKASLKIDAELLSISEEVERLTAELRNNIMNIRMLPIGTTFNMFKRVVRDLSTELGKEAILLTEGGQTELDKTVIDQLNDPLIHIIRNCIDHGIEPPEIREKKGKSKQGIIRLCAEHSGASVLISISDDGAGINKEAVRQKAVEKGLIAQDTPISDEDMIKFIFAPGFSTSKSVSDVSGRGVGMDVVKRSIEALHGSVTVHSQPEKGTKITLKLPLTLAIIDGLLVKIGDENFVLPLAIVEECIELSQRQASAARIQNIIDFRGEIVPYINLRGLFFSSQESFQNNESAQPTLIVIVESKNGRIGLEVDHVIGQYQTVIKSLGKMYQTIPWISGATILGDGSIALIIDVNQLLKIAEYQ